jgi:TonB-dependent starch-binding outer membrane protein SusC
MKKFLLMCFLLAFAVSGWAQERTVSGRVTSTEDGSALPGVNVILKGSSVGTATDGDGRYSLIVPSSSGVLVFSFIGLKAQEIQIGDRSVVDASLAVDATELSEVVVTGYGTQLKQDLTGNIARIKTKDIEYVPMPTIDAVLQGKAAGVYVNSQSGKLGQAVSVRVRGNSSISAGNQPLYVLDGVPITTYSQSTYGGATNPLIDLNPNDIESIEVLKDASAGAIYGSRAANGVVLITTKRGKSGKTNFTFNYQQGYSESTRRVKMLNSDQYTELLLEAAQWVDENVYDIPAAPGEGGETDYVIDWMDYYSYGEWSYDDYINGTKLKTYEWQDAIFQKGPYRQADIQLSGGNEYTKFFFSGQYLDQDGIMIGNNIKRVSARLNLDQKVNSWLNIGVNMNFARTLNRRLPDDNAFSNPLQSVALMPMTPNVTPAGQPGAGLPSGTPPGDVQIPMYYNPIITVKYAKYLEESFRNFTNGFATIKLMPGLTLQSEFGLDLLSQNAESYFQSQTRRNQTRATRGLGSNRGAFVLNYNTNNYFSYTKRFGKHDVNSTLGMQYQESNAKYNFVEGLDFPSDSYQKIASAATISGGSSTETNYSFLSYFLRANYKFADKYLFGVSARIDGSSRFGANNRYGFFPSVSGGWILTEEEFLKGVTSLSFLKLRASYGIVGNAEIGNFPQLGLFSGSASYSGIGGQAPSQIGNPNLKWETNKQFDIGIDFGVLQNRITGEIDYYIRKSEDLLLNTNIPSSTGFNSVVRNLGSLENKGVEIVLNSENFIGQFKWSTSFNIAFNKGKVLDVNGQIIEGGVGNLNRVMEGYNIGVFFAPEYAGVNPDNGDAQFYSNVIGPDGKRDRTILGNDDYNQAERVVVGDPNPKCIAGLTNTFSYKGFDLSILFNGVFGNDVSVFGMGQYSMASMIYEDNQTADQMKRWQQPGDKTNVPATHYFYGNGNQRSSRFIVDGSFIRLRSLNFGYSLPKELLQPLKVERCRIYISGQNLLTFTRDYPLWDPEVNADSFDSNVSKGNDFYTPPQPRTFLVGINIGL